MASIYDNHNFRLRTRGGNAEGRFQQDKLRGLKKALLYSYQAETAILSDGRMFRCLLNPNKLKADYDIKEISIPFKDICIGHEGNEEAFDPTEAKPTMMGEEEIGMKTGDVFQIQKDGSHWLVVERFLEEDIYFRGEVYRCDQEVTVGDKTYWAYIRGPVETSIQWNKKGHLNWNDLNYSLVMYITQDENTLEKLHRFTTIKLKDPGSDKLNNWRVEVVDPYYYDGVIQVMLQEEANNKYADGSYKDEVEEIPELIPGVINGPDTIAPFDTYTYSVAEGGGQWKLNESMRKKLRVISHTDTEVNLYVETGRSSDFELKYSINGEDIIKKIHIESL